MPIRRPLDSAAPTAHSSVAQMPPQWRTLAAAHLSNMRITCLFEPLVLALTVTSHVSFRRTAVQKKRKFESQTTSKVGI